MVEYSAVSRGITALDIITKAAEVDILSSQTICPGKYMILFCGGLGAVKAALEAARHVTGIIDEFVLGRPHQSIFAALDRESPISGKATIEGASTPTANTSCASVLPYGGTALGLVETFSGAAAIKAADTAAKTAWINLVEIHIAHGMCGKSTVMFTGEVAAVSAALDAAKSEAEAKGMLLDTALIPNPDKKMLAAIANR